MLEQIKSFLKNIRGSRQHKFTKYRTAPSLSLIHISLDEPEGHYGLNIMTERSRQLNAQLTISKGEQGGTMVKITPVSYTHLNIYPLCAEGIESI